MSNSVSLGDLSTNFLLSSQGTRLRASQDQLIQELSTGISADVSRKTGGDYSVLSQINSGMKLVSAYQEAAVEAGFLADTAQNVLSSMQSRILEFAADTQTVASTGQGSVLNAQVLGSEAILTDMFSLLNSQAAGQSVFGGRATDNAAIASVDDVLAALDPLVAGLTDPVDVQNAISTWMADPAGFDDVAYLGDVPRDTVQVGTTVTTNMSVTARDPGIKTAIEGILLATYVDRAPDLTDVAGQRELLNQAASTLRDADAGLVELQASVGVEQEKITNARAANAAENSALSISRRDLIGVDQYVVATDLESTQSQLQILYELTSRVSRLSLLEFLR